MASIDYIIIITLVISVVFGIMRGFLRQVFGLGGLIIGIILGSFLYRPFSELLLEKVSMKPETAQILAYVLILIVVPIVCGLLGQMLSRLVHGAGLGLLNRLFGAVSGALIWLLLAGVIIHLVEITGGSKKIVIRQCSEDTRKGSYFYGPVRDVSGQCLQWTWNKVRNIDLPTFDNDSKK